MQEVGVLAETITVLSNVVEDPALALKLSAPFVSAVVGLCRLQATKNVLVRISDPGDLFYSDGPVERIVCI